MPHLILLGDSIFDNSVYVRNGPAVEDHLRHDLPSDWKVTLLARDGATAEDVHPQLAQLPADATHLVLSVGGNNALGIANIVLHERASSYSQVLTALAGHQRAFEEEYRILLRVIVQTKLPIAVCTVYESIPDLAPAELAGLALYNDVILREAFRHGLAVIDLRLVCTEHDDYSSDSPIEPSAQGGVKISRAIVGAVCDPLRAACSVFV